MSLGSTQSHFIFLKTFVLATSGLEVRMQDWQAGFVVSLLGLPQFYHTRVYSGQSGLLERELDWKMHICPPVNERGCTSTAERQPRCRVQGYHERPESPGQLDQRNVCFTSAIGKLCAEESH